MKKNLMLLFIAVAIYSCNQTKPSAEAPEATVTETEQTNSTFGASFAEASALTTEELQQLVVDKDSVQATVKGEVVESCQSKGCWMDIKLADNSTMKVTFRDYGFFMPVEDLTGRTVVFTGTAKRGMMSVEKLRHYAEDAGKSAEEVNAITEPREELLFVADGVILK